MSNFEQLAPVNSIEQTPALASEGQPHNLSSSMYGAEAQVSWKKVFGAVAPKDKGEHRIIGETPFEHLLLIPTIDEQVGLPEFGKRPTDIGKDGIPYLTDKAKEILGVGQTLHDKVKELVIAGLTPEQRAAYLQEEKERKETYGSRRKHYDPETCRYGLIEPGPMTAMVNKLTLAAEQKMASMSKQNLTPVERLQLERALVNGYSNEQTKSYEQKLLKLVSDFESKGELPKGFVPQIKTPEPIKFGTSRDIELQPTHPRQACREVVTRNPRMRLW